MNPVDYEKLGAFYLGRAVDPTSGVVLDEPVLYPSRHLTTHAVIVGMTGSGKTGLGVVMLEEAAIDGVPSIIVDPKGDLGSLMLAFAEPDAATLGPWVPTGEDPHALSERHVRGLRESGQEVSRIGRLEGAVERTLYTPGSRVGRPLALLPSLDVPPEDDAELVRERAMRAATSLLTLVGVDADPLAGPEHTLVSNVILGAWSAGRGLDPASLVREVQRPSFDRIGALDLETVCSTKDRTALAARFNNAFASPAFADFLVGEALDVGRLLFTAAGRPRMSILSIAHLSDADRMSFVTLLLGDLVRWMRTQQGTSSLRAVFYMDEVFGYFPPVAVTPAKPAMLMLLKQARAFGLGIILATQNPVDLDYKGLSNAGTWLLGRLPTERDKLRVLDGLDGASSASGTAFDRSRLDGILSGLAPRTFVLHDVNEPAPRLLQTRWTLSFLRGPLSRTEIRTLATTATGENTARAVPEVAPAASAGGRPALPGDVTESFLVRTDLASVCYRPGLLVRSTLHFVDAKAGIDRWSRPTLIAPIHDDGPAWAEGWWLETEPNTAREPTAGASFAQLPALAMRAATYASWRKAAATHLLRERPLVIWTAPALRLSGAPGEARDLFAARVAQTTRERRDAEAEALAAKWRPKLERASAQLDKARDQLEDATADRNTQALASGLEVGATLLGAVFGRRSALRGAASVATKARRAQKKQVDRERAQAEIQEGEARVLAMKKNLEQAIQTLRTSWDPAHVELVERPLTARKSDLTIDRIELVWVPVSTAGA